MSPTKEETNSRELWYEFTQEVTMHGIKHANTKQYSAFKRVAWVFLILLCLAYFLGASSTFLKDFTQKKLITNIRVEKATQLPFPTVTICNNNNWRYSFISQSNFSMGSSVIFEVTQDLYNMDRPVPPPADKYNISDPFYAPALTINSTMFMKFFKEAAHPLETSILLCYMSGQIYPCQDVFDVVPTDAELKEHKCIQSINVEGFCYQFNSNGSFNASAPGKVGGVSFLLNTDVEEYSTGPNSYSEGFTVAFHNPYEEPQVTEQGVGLSPGTQANIVLHKSETKRYPPPADHGRANCLDTKTIPNPLKYYTQYSYSGCMVECKAKYVIDRCGCRDFLQPAYNNAEICLIRDMLYCSNPALRRFAGDEKGVKACNCPDTCHDNEFVPKVSTYKFPSANYIKEKQIQEGVAEKLSKNNVVVDIFYGKMSYQRLEEDLAYSIFDMIANLGGTLGLCVGASILTIFEFFEFGIKLLSFHLCNQQRRRNEDTFKKIAPTKDLLSDESKP